MKAVYKRRLLKLAAFLRGPVAQAEYKARKTGSFNKLFDMGLWMQSDRRGHDHKHASLECGTTACAAGWATAIFPSLYFDIDHQHIHMRGVDCDACDASDVAGIAAFFGIGDNCNLRHLFLSGSYRSAVDEAEIIELFVAGQERE